MHKPAGRATINRVWSGAECTEKSLTNVTACRRYASMVDAMFCITESSLGLNYFCH